MAAWFMKFWSYGVGIPLMRGLICNGDLVSLLSIYCSLFLHNIFKILYTFHAHCLLPQLNTHMVFCITSLLQISQRCMYYLEDLFSARHCLLSCFSHHLWKFISSVHLLSIEVHSFGEILLSIIQISRCCRFRSN
jgi:hypothetical protein